MSKGWRKSIVFLFLAVWFFVAPTIVLAETNSFAPAELLLIPDYEHFLDPDFLYIDVVASPRGNIINAARINLNFEADKLELIAIDYADSFCALFISELIDNAGGSLDIQCGRPNGSSGEQLLVARLIFAKLRTDWAKLDLLDSKLMANDNKGTNLLIDAGVSNIYIYK